MRCSARNEGGACCCDSKQVQEAHRSLLGLLVLHLQLLLRGDDLHSRGTVRKVADSLAIPSQTQARNVSAIGQWFAPCPMRTYLCRCLSHLDQVALHVVHGLLQDLLWVFRL